MIALVIVKWLAIGAFALGVAASGWILRHAPETLPAFDRHRLRLDAALDFLRQPRAGSAIGTAQWVVGASSLALARMLASLWPIAIALLCATIPAVVLGHRRRARVAQIEAQLDGWLVTLANALRATPSLGDALASSVSTTAAPFSLEIDLMLKEHRLGAPLERALDDLAQRVDSRSLTALLLTLQIARTSGGGVSQSLERAAATLREMLRLDGVVRAKTAEGKAQAFVICVIPFPFFGLLQVVDPQLFSPLTGSTTGHAVLAAAAALWLAAVALARRIVQVDI